MGSVNLMAMNLTNQVYSIKTEATKSVTAGDLTRNVEVKVHSEIKGLKITVNGMTKSLNLFANEATCVAR